MVVIRTVSGHEFELTGDEPILNAAERAGVNIAYSCRAGRCSSCAARVVAGTTTPLHDELGLEDDERADGVILTCVRTAEDDAEIEPIEPLIDVRLPPARFWPCLIDDLERVAPTILKVTLRLPPDAQPSLIPGQHVEAIVGGGARRDYSLANVPDAGRLELHIRELPGGELSDYWFGKAAVGDLVHVRGPLGTFVLGDVTDRDLVFLATGTGIAPVMSIVGSLEGHDTKPRSVTVYWGNRDPQEFYWAPPEGVRFVPVLSRPAEGWEGVGGYVQDHVLGDLGSLEHADVYACGSDAMIHAARAVLTGHGLGHDRFHSDAFVSSSPV